MSKEGLKAAQRQRLRKVEFCPEHNINPGEARTLAVHKACNSLHGSSYHETEKYISQGVLIASTARVLLSELF